MKRCPVNNELVTYMDCLDCEDYNKCTTIDDDVYDNNTNKSSTVPSNKKYHVLFVYQRELYNLGTYDTFEESFKALQEDVRNVLLAHGYIQKDIDNGVEHAYEEWGIGNTQAWYTDEKDEFHDWYIMET